ncbi:alpha-amylase [Segetibacter sp. 3557_3]|uniref:glycoside hydrolase family 13 protein n=1 Tax=Segetibacter sp. 3557_3 TaxID=2547429 RepID=UPI001058EE0D|nr:glycoside hydrolase family 13 protein [Segetibacter sp. 3557_3]TDH26519.1 alpha-amylase [Segetibacter sp. 3557_3]
MKNFVLLLFFVFGFISSYAQTPIQVYPSNWWVGMKNPKVQLMLHGDNVRDLKLSANYPGVRVEKISKVESPNYLFIDLVISRAAKPGSLVFKSARPSDSRQVVFEIKPRRKGKGTAFAQGVTSADFIYLLMPDRFCNGDTGNDRVAGMKDQSLNRDSMYHRHGGDMQGVISKLDYLQDLGVTALWMTPVLENDMPNRTEHGYAFTNHYKIDPRLGGANAYHQLSDALHKRGMKLVQDAVYNHIGAHHFTVTDPPMKDWLHQWPQYTQTSYKDQSLFDPYAAAADKARMSNGWFTREMPDINQSNLFAANYLIQHALWCVETFGVDGWRIDTYIYNDLEFMNRCNKALLDEYPSLSLFGETWVHGTANQAYFTLNNLVLPFKSNLPGVTDFQTNLYGIAPALNQGFGWTDGVNKLYQTLTNDFLYKDPMKHVIFLDNHDVSRFLSQVNDDTAKLKMALAWLFTCRGIPQLYYGTEILMKGVSNPDGLVRADFEGGWRGDSLNKFTVQGRTKAENSIHDLTTKLANFRKNSSAIKTGRMLQYVPDDGLYVYFRYDQQQSIMCVMNTADTLKTIDWSKFEQGTANFRSAQNVVNKSTLIMDKAAAIPAKQMWVLELKK